jgi:2-methylcitrate dehydratase PrpD
MMSLGKYMEQALTLWQLIANPNLQTGAQACQWLHESQAMVHYGALFQGAVGQALDTDEAWMCVPWHWA